MTPEKRNATIKRAILEALDDCGTHAMPEASLVTECYVAVRPVPTHTEVVNLLRSLEADGYVVGLPGALGGGNRYMITTDGKLVRHA